MALRIVARTSVHIAWGGLLLGSLAACQSAGDGSRGRANNLTQADTVAGDPMTAGDLDVGDEAAAADTDLGDASRATCGMAQYQWLPSSAVGAVLEDQTIYQWSELQVKAAQSYIYYETGIMYSRAPAHDVELHRIRYQTQDRGALIDATGMVLFPTDAGPASFPVLLFLHGTCGFADVCAPSRNIEDDGSGNYFNAVLAGLFASWGYVVVMPDYLGMKSLGAPSPELHPYLVGEPTAIASWDAVRAGLKVVEGVTGQVTQGQPVLVWGASQGGHAAAFTVRYAPHYAPEYTIAGSVWSVPPTNLMAHTTLALTTIRKASANTVGFMAAAEQWYGPLTTGLSPVFKPPFDTTVQPALLASCSPDVLDGVSALDQLFTDGLLSAVASYSFDTLQPWYCMAEQNSLPTTDIPRQNDVPSLMILGELDDLVDPGVERESFAILCGQGERLEMLECTGAGHGEAFFWSIDQAFDFMEARLSGTPLSTLCVAQAAAACQNQP